MCGGQRAWGPEDGGGLPPRHAGRRGCRPAGQRLHHPRAESCTVLWPNARRDRKPTCYTSSPCPHTPYTPTPSPSEEPPEFVSYRRRVRAASIAGGAGMDLVVSRETAPSWGGPGACGHAGKCRWMVAGPRGCPVSWGCARGGGGPSRPRCRAPTSPPGRRPSAVMSHPGPSPSGPSPSGPAAARRPSLSPRDKPAGGWGSGAARSQPARREGRGAGRAGGPQPSRGAAVRAPSAAREQQPLCARPGPAPLPVLMPRGRRQ